MPEHLKLIQLATAVRAAQKDYFRNRRSPGWKGYLEKSLRLELDLGECLKKENHAGCASHAKLIDLATAMLNAQQEYFQNRQSPNWKGYLEKSKRLERELDEYLKKANHADNLQQQLF